MITTYFIGAAIVLVALLILISHKVANGRVKPETISFFRVFVITVFWPITAPIMVLMFLFLVIIKD